MRRSLSVIVVLAGALALPAAALGSSGSAGLSPIDPSSSNAKGIADIYWFVLAWAGLIFLVVIVPLIVFVVRFRSRGRPRHEEGPQVHGSTRLELGWTVAPIVVVLILGIFVAVRVSDINNPAGAAEPGSIQVQARQFYWQYVYPNGAISINTVVIPVDKVTTFEVTAPPGDVIHSFWVPSLDGKRDAIPGKVNELKMLPTKLGAYPVRCAELCGLQHAKMDGTVEVVPAAQYTAAITALGRSQQTKAGELALGKAIFQGACATCHGLQGQGLVGPALAGNPQAGNVANVTKVVEGGGITMPAVGQGWSKQELDALTAYLSTHVASTTGSSGGG